MVITHLDEIDRKLLSELTTDPRMGVVELARRLGVARGTAQARLDKLRTRHVISGFEPSIDLRSLGYEVLAFTTLETAQGRLDDVVEHIREIPEVLEAHAIAGAGDLLCRVVAHNNEHLHTIINHMLEVHGIMRSRTVIALSEQIPWRLLPVIRAAEAVS